MAAGVLVTLAWTGIATAHGTDPGGAPVQPEWVQVVHERAFVEDARGSSTVASTIHDFQLFDPAVLVIDAGTTIEWSNVGLLGLGHQVDTVDEAGPIAPESIHETVAPGETVSHTFSTPGTYYIRCNVNAFHAASMHQVIHVR